MRLLWLADVLREAGLSVVEHSGWKTRGWSDWSPRYGIVHATAAPRSQSDATQVAIVRDGHSTLQGPIANCCVDRDGRWHVLASGRCNTARPGWGGPASGLGNTHLLGVEAANDNRSERWSGQQYEAYARGWAAICRRMGWPASHAIGHKEHQPGDKSDPTFSMGSFRARVAGYMEEDDMPSKEEIAKATVDELERRRYPRADKTGVISLADAAEWGRHHAGGTKVLARQLVKGQVALLAALQGLDTAAILARIDQRAEEDAARDEAMLELLSQHASGALDADAVVRRIGELLAAGQPDGS